MSLSRAGVALTHKHVKGAPQAGFVLRKFLHGFFGGVLVSEMNAFASHWASHHVYPNAPWNSHVTVHHDSDHPDGAGVFVIPFRTYFAGWTQDTAVQGGLALNSAWFCAFSLSGRGRRVPFHLFGMALGLVFHFFLTTWLHFAHHQGSVKGIAGLSALSEHHELHHRRMGEGNYSLGFLPPVFDWAFGCLRWTVGSP
uniref:Fatty acid hydroxylase domain-containing protein n=1 Tax=Chromera velia CCMP2878 TaxID=1169474 RepID=A0A0G4HTK7_9ALVE|eukprot:Cvel_8502.t1-p1 / transcript=Cvel_8502.t1 / gene=Cvel_8502 / organism=Chromera_velia_CCMP2878 / gene_product=hypothetical protein / transcript_product=hypothetical protein / location=Cvel_scaffold470:23444-24945(+) / protein_length=196 / sequence_SO=supercontig / SO=protein_coding / is_pseudo=false